MLCFFFSPLFLTLQCFNVPPEIILKKFWFSFFRTKFQLQQLLHPAYSSNISLSSMSLPTFRQGSSCMNSDPPHLDMTQGHRSQVGLTPADSSGPACSCSWQVRPSPGPLGSSSQRHRVRSRWCWLSQRSSSQVCRPGSR